MDFGIGQTIPGNKSGYFKNYSMAGKDDKNIIRKIL
jgi:hypothetical protein